jgi:hypothetical protein
MKGKARAKWLGGILLAILSVLSCGRQNVLEPLIEFEEIGSCATLGYAQDVVVVDSIAYLATGQACLELVNVADPEAPFEVAYFDTTVGTVNYATSIDILDDKVYVGYGYDGMLIVDVSLPTQPTRVGLLEDFRVEDLFPVAYGNSTYVFVAGRYRFVSVDATDPVYPSLIGRIETPGNARGLFVRSPFAYVANEQLGLQIVDISDPSSPAIVGGIDTPSNARDVCVSGDYAYVADGRGGLRIVDVSDVDSLVVVGHCDTPGYAKRIAVQDGYAYVADGSKGLQVIDVASPASPFLVGTYSTPYAHGVFVTDDHVYLADRDLGLVILSWIY